MNKELETAKKETLAMMSEQDAAKLRKEKALAEAAEDKNTITKMELARVKGEMCLVEDITFAFRNLTATISQRLNEIPATRAGDLISIKSVAEGQKFLQELVDDAIEDLNDVTVDSLIKRQIKDKEKEGINARAKKEKTAMGQKGIRKQKVKK